MTECMHSLRQNLQNLKRVILVDNCDSPQGFVRDPTIIDGLPINVIKTKPAIGFGRACNVGMLAAERSGCDAIVLLNQDTKLTPGTLQALADCLLDDVFASFPVSLTLDLSELTPRYVELYMARHTEFVADMYLGRLKDHYSIPFDGANAACVALNPSLLGSVGYFDPLYWMYTEERDLFFRAAADGYRLLLVPKAIIGHAHANFSKIGAARLRLDAEIRKGQQIFAVKSSSIAVSGVVKCIRLTIRSILSMAKRRHLRALLRALQADLGLPGRVLGAIRHRNKVLMIKSTIKQAAADSGVD